MAAAPPPPRFVEYEDMEGHGIRPFRGLVDVPIYILLDAVMHAVTRDPDLSAQFAKMLASPKLKKRIYDMELFAAAAHFDGMRADDRRSLSRDQVGAIHFYSQPTGFHKILNRRCVRFQLLFL